MDLSIFQDILNAVSQALKYPVIILLLLSIVYALFEIGSLLVELIIERRHFKIVLPEFQQDMEKATVDEMPDMVRNSGLLLRQKTALLTLFSNRDLPEEARWALAKKLLGEQATHYGNIALRNEMMAKVSPMLGLMGTLIPLGPGIVAMGKGDTAQLASSMLVAFDTTVAGLVAAVVCMVIARIRRSWYASYSSALEAGVTTMLEKIELLGTEEKSETADDDQSEVRA